MPNWKNLFKVDQETAHTWIKKVKIKNANVVEEETFTTAKPTSVLCVETAQHTKEELSLKPKPENKNKKIADGWQALMKILEMGKLGSKDWCGKFNAVFGRKGWRIYETTNGSR